MKGYTFSIISGSPLEHHFRRGNMFSFAEAGLLSLFPCEFVHSVACLCRIEEFEWTTDSLMVQRDALVFGEWLWATRRKCLVARHGHIQPHREDEADALHQEEVESIYLYTAIFIII